MGLLSGKGITVILHEHPAGWLWTPFEFDGGEATDNTTVDELNHPVYEERVVKVENVLVGPMSQTEINDNYTMYGRKGVYELGIPKGDKHVWVGGQVEFFGQTWSVIGVPVKGIDALVPTDWNLKVYVEATNYEQ